MRKLCSQFRRRVYGENPDSPKTETMRPDPSTRAITKLDGEYYCDLYAREAGCARLV